MTKLSFTISTTLFTFATIGTVVSCSKGENDSQESSRNTINDYADAITVIAPQNGTKTIAELDRFVELSTNPVPVPNQIFANTIATQLGFTSISLPTKVSKPADTVIECQLVVKTTVAGSPKVYTLIVTVKNNTDVITKTFDIKSSDVVLS